MNLTQIIADLFAKQTGGEELSPKIQRLRDEIKKVFEGEATVYGKFRGLLQSLRQVIPDEKQCYHAALQALSTTSKLSRQEIITAVNAQLEELKILEKGLMPALPNWRDDLKAMEARSNEIKGEIAKLREKIAQLESEEKKVLSGKAEREKELALVEKTTREFFANIRAEITSIKSKVEEFTAEGTAAQPAPPAAQPAPPAAQPTPPAVQPTPPKEPPKSSAPVEKKGGSERAIEIKGPPPPVDSKWQKKCPMCGGQMHLLELEKMWQCFSCAHEESTDDVQGKSAPAAETGVAASPSFVEPLASMTSHEDQESSASDDQPSTKKKTCPVCRKKMYWYPDTKAWKCPSCHYERRI
jgi:ribosomal protein L37AE/L43A